MKLRLIEQVDPIKFSENKVLSYIDGSTFKYDVIHSRRRFSADSVTCAFFKDGTILACISSHTGPYSEVTPDIDYDIEFWVAQEEKE